MWLCFLIPFSLPHLFVSIDLTLNGSRSREAAASGKLRKGLCLSFVLWNCVNSSWIERNKITHVCIRWWVSFTFLLSASPYCCCNSSQTKMILGKLHYGKFDLGFVSVGWLTSTKRHIRYRFSWINYEQKKIKTIINSKPTCNWLDP